MYTFMHGCQIWKLNYRQKWKFLSNGTDVFCWRCFRGFWIFRKNIICHIIYTNDVCLLNYDIFENIFSCFVGFGISLLRLMEKLWHLSLLLWQCRFKQNITDNGYRRAIIVWRSPYWNCRTSLSKENVPLQSNRRLLLFQANERKTLNAFIKSCSSHTFSMASDKAMKQNRKLVLS